MEAGKDACMLQFNSDTKLTSEEFVKVFKEFDKDGNGYIEADELNMFLVTLLQETGNEANYRTIHWGFENGYLLTQMPHLQKYSTPSPEELEKFKEYVLEKYDENCDGKISMDELENILPTEENYLKQFRAEFSS
ncbi:calretinin-like [Stylophora pistillata]|uniref:calretinin-like n=1 Tax=Stylophora pistillata TaxID=50429 RepID=UPI000C03F03C|nr:calretinin-like [Stylophora pistillata]